MLHKNFVQIKYSTLYAKTSTSVSIMHTCVANATIKSRIHKKCSKNADFVQKKSCTKILCKKRRTKILPKTLHKNFVQPEGLHKKFVQKKSLHKNFVQPEGLHKIFVQKKCLHTFFPLVTGQGYPNPVQKKSLHNFCTKKKAYLPNPPNSPYLVFDTKFFLGACIC